MNSIIAPEASASLTAGLLLGPAVIIGFFIVGHFGFRWLPSGQPIATAFVASGLVLFFTVLTGNFLRIPLRREFLLGLVGAVALGGWLLTRKSRPISNGVKPSLEWLHARRWGSELWWLVPGLIATGSLFAHLVLEPLSGYDNVFRWDYLARMIASEQTLQHYPPVTAADFSVYPWCDGIPPMVPVLNLWLYLFTGSSAEIIASLRAGVEFVLTVAFVWQLSCRLWGASGAKVSLLLLATSSLFLCAISMGQETGLGGVVLLTISMLLLDYRDKPQTATAVWIGLTAGFGGLCRDYYLIFLPVSLVLFGFVSARKKHWWLAAGTMIAVVAPWYLRNAWITGNPLFPQALAGLFPTNAAHQRAMREIQEFWSLFADQWNPVSLLKTVFVGAGALLLAALPGLMPNRFERIVLAALTCTMVALWLTSISSTAGGWTYSLRVLGPALPLLAVAAGGVSRLLQGRWAYVGAALCALLAVDAARRSWSFVQTPTDPVLPYTWQQWRSWTRFIRNDRDLTIWTILQRVANGERILVDHPNFFVLGRRANANMISMFSPEAAAVWRNAPPLSSVALRKALREQHVRFVVLSGRTEPQMYFYKSAPGVMQLLAQQPTMTIGALWLYDLTVLEPPPSAQ